MPKGTPTRGNFDKENDVHVLQTSPKKSIIYTSLNFHRVSALSFTRLDEVFIKAIRRNWVDDGKTTYPALVKDRIHVPG